MKVHLFLIKGSKQNDKAELSMSKAIHAKAQPEEVSLSFIVLGTTETYLVDIGSNFAPREQV